MHRFAQNLGTPVGPEPAGWPALAQGTYKIGEINSYKAQPAFLEPYKKGMELAVEQVNASGGIAGRKLQLVVRDDNANPGDAVRAAEELLAREKVDADGQLSLARGPGADGLCAPEKVFFLAAEPLTDKIVGERQPLHLPPARLHLHAGGHAGARGRRAQEEALGHRLPQLRIRPVGRGHVQEAAQAGPARCGVRGRAGCALGKVDASGVVQAPADAKPDAIFNVLFAADLARFVREGNTRGLFQGREVVSLLTGEPEYLDPSRTKPHRLDRDRLPLVRHHHARAPGVLKAYQDKYKDHPRLGSVVGYTAIQSLAAGMQGGRGRYREAHHRLPGLELTSPFGPIRYRAEDHQSTMGAFVGKTRNEGGKGRDGQLPLRRWRQVPAQRRRGQEAARSGLIPRD